MTRVASRRTLRIAVTIAAALLAATGCGDRFRSADTSPPRIVEVILVDQDGAVPAREVIPAGNDVLVTDVPLNLSRIRVRFSKPVDGSTIQRDPNPVLNGSEPGGNLLPLGCTPAANVEVMQAGGSSASTFAASVCYDPSGPDMVVEPATATCGGPVPAAAYGSAASSTAGGFPTLERGATYLIRASGVKDQQGNAISFTVTVVTSTALALATDPADPSVQPVLVSTEYATDGTVVGYAALDPTSTLAGVPQGPPADPAVAAPIPARMNEKTRFAAFGPDILVRFDAPLCTPLGSAADLPELPGYCAPMGVDTGNIPGVKLSLGGQEVGSIGDPQAAALHFPFRGGYETVSDRYVDGAAGAVHVVPWLPLEDGENYTLTVDGGVTDVTGAAFGTTLNFAFQAAAGDFRVQLVQPPNGADGVPPTTDLVHLASASSGHGIEFITSRPLALDGTGRPVGTVELHEGDASGPLAAHGGVPIGADVATLDMRARWFVVGASAGQGDLALKPGQRYTIVLQGLVSAADPSVAIPSYSWSFTTAPFSRDSALSVPVVASAIDGVDPVPGTGGEVRGAFLVQYVSGKVKHDGAATPAVAPQQGGEQLFPLLGAAGTTASIALWKVRDASGAPCSAAACEVAGISGYAKTTTGLDLFANGAASDANPNLRTADRAAAKPRAGLPHSAIGFLPDAPLEPGAAYQLTLSNVVDVNDVPLADADGVPLANGQLVIPFTTRPFAVRRVLSQAALAAGERGEPLQSGARFVTVDASHPLTVELRASPELPTGGTTMAGDLTNDPVALVDLATGKAVPIAIAPDPGSTLRLTVNPVSALAAGRTYSLLVTNKLRSRAQTPGGGVGASPFSVAFTTPDARDAGGNLVCQ